MKKKFEKERRFLISQLQRLDYGRNQLNRIIAPVSFVISVVTLLKVYNVSFNANQMFGLSAVGMVVIYFIGLIWDNLGFVEEEIEFTNERNRFVRALLKKSWLKKLRKAEIK